MIIKKPIVPQRLRRIPRQFSWLDHRLVQEGYLQRCTHASAALYLFLVTVGDASGLSYYSERALTHRLAMDAAALERARTNLIQIGLIAWQAPLYQVLALDVPPHAVTGLTALQDILQLSQSNPHD